MLLSKVEDKQLVREYLNGKERAFEVLISRYKDRVYGYVYKMVKDEDLTNDIFQDTFIKVINTLKKGKYNEEGKFLPWVMRIAHNLVIDYFRRSNRIPKFECSDDYDVFKFINLTLNFLLSGRIIGRLSGHINIMWMTFYRSSRGNFNKFCYVQFLNFTRPTITHTCSKSSHHLIKNLGNHPFERHPTYDAFGY